MKSSISWHPEYEKVLYIYMNKLEATHVEHGIINVKDSNIHNDLNIVF